MLSRSIILLIANIFYVAFSVEHLEKIDFINTAFLFRRNLDTSSPNIAEIGHRTVGGIFNGDVSINYETNKPDPLIVSTNQIPLGIMITSNETIFFSDSNNYKGLICNKSYCSGTTHILRIMCTATH